ncbi:MAG: hypothetical protein AAF657_15215 [Acidobacteriota bacterium]
MNKCLAPPSGSGSDLDAPVCDCEVASANSAAAQAQLAEAQAEIDTGRFARAIEHYRKAWELACLAIESVAGCV